MAEQLISVEHQTPQGTIDLRRPRQHMRAIQIQRLALEMDEPMLACAAALGVCWQAGVSDRKPRADWVKLKGAWRYGEAVCDELIKRGWSMTDVLNGGQAALPLVMAMLADMVTEDEVKASEAFTDAPED